MNEVLTLLQEVTQQDLEICEAAIRASDQAAAIDSIERVFAKLSTAIDMLRSVPNA